MREEWAGGGRWRGLDGAEMETPGRRGGVGEEIATEILEGKQETKREAKLLLNISQLE